MSKVLSTLFEHPVHQAFVRTLEKKNHLVLSGLGNATSKAFWVADILEHSPHKKIIWLVNNKNDLYELKNNLELFVKTTIHTFLNENDPAEAQQERIRFLQDMETIKQGVIITTPHFLHSGVPPKEEIKGHLLHIIKGEERSMYGLFEDLIRAGYKQSGERMLSRGTYANQGGVLAIFPFNSPAPIRVEFFGDTVEDIVSYDQERQKILTSLDKVSLFPGHFSNTESSLFEFVPKDVVIIDDELDLGDYGDELEKFHKELRLFKDRHKYINITVFPELENEYHHLRYLSVLKYYTVTDFLNDLRAKDAERWRIVVYTKTVKEVQDIFSDNDVEFTSEVKTFLTRAKQGRPLVLLLESEDLDIVPRSFQNPQEKILFLSDREIFSAKSKKSLVREQGSVDFLASLKAGDYVVHLDHGIGRFAGIDKKTFDEITKEYLEIHYAENDRLFVPVDQADKVSKYIGNESSPPKLTRLDSTEWQQTTKKVRAETEKIAKELLLLYAKREMAEGHNYDPKEELMKQFGETFPYEETPGQLKAISEVMKDMNELRPMDRLICGDVGFGKTEVAMRASFRAFLSKKQVAFISPITILADQHYKSFRKRMEEFGVRVEMLSRFKSKKEQGDILEDLKKGEIDILIGTHRLLQTDVDFKDLGLVIIDEEQRFGVKQKEKLKRFRCNVDVLTLTATPIPRTLNMSLNKLRDISIITTPPPGRLPIITEVRKVSDALIREVTLKEIERGGQVYFLYNKVRTIEGIAEKLRNLMPEARVLVAHGQLESKELERRIMQFKDKEYDVLVSSTIIENGIDLPNANTLIVHNADALGLSQLYQLRGRVGRGRIQAYCYLMYNQAKLPLDAKKRLRAIVEASELGSGFQIAMRDMEIRGAGDILGSSQHGAINSVGVSHFVRMLHQAIEDLKQGKYDENEQKEIKDVAIELPLTSYIPDYYINDYEEKITVYQRLSGIQSRTILREFRKTVEQQYGTIPEEVENLFKVLQLKLLAKERGLTGIRMIPRTNTDKDMYLGMGEKITPEHIFNLLQYNSKWMVSGDKLKIDMKHLGLNWYKGLWDSVDNLRIAREEAPKEEKKNKKESA